MLGECQPLHSYYFVRMWEGYHNATFWCDQALTVVCTAANSPNIHLLCWLNFRVWNINNQRFLLIFNFYLNCSKGTKEKTLSFSIKMQMVNISSWRDGASIKIKLRGMFGSSCCFDHFGHSLTQMVENDKPKPRHQNILSETCGSHHRWCTFCTQCLLFAHSVGCVCIYSFSISSLLHNYHSLSAWDW